MMRQYELVERVKRYNPDADEALLNRAYVYAMKAHKHQTRESGDPYLMHPLEVAAILTDLKLDDATIVAAVLHDTVEDTDATLDDIEALFGKQIARLVEGLTKIRKLDLVTKEAAQGENFRKLLLAVADDVRVLLVKLADRLHNMRTLDCCKPEKRKRIAEETLEIYAPLAGRMGMQGMREELEESSFRYVNPEAHATILQRLDTMRQANKGLIQETVKALEAVLATAKLQGTVNGREKRPYSIFQKMERHSLAFEQLADIYGFRVIVEDVDQCYRVLGAVHGKWPCIPGKFKDYISTPKSNDYQSLHTTVIGPRHQRLELQIRTKAMHEVGENGIAAHALYKDGKTIHLDDLAKDSRAFQWLRKTVDMLSEGLSPDEFLEHTKLELFHDQVFAFTPKGRLIALPRGATAIDFAYAVHTDIGDTAISSKVNGRLAPLTGPIVNGDTVEILCAPGQTPPTAWEGVVRTGRARAAIRRATRASVRRQYAGLGRQIVDRAFERAGRVFDDDKLRAALPRLARSTNEDVYAAVGRAEMDSNTVLKALYPDYVAEVAVPVRKQAQRQARERGWFGFRKNASLVFRAPDGAIDTNAIPIRGLTSDLPVRFAPNGGAVPGDRIVGILEPGEGITIYPIHAKALAAFDDTPERWLDVRWDVDPEAPSRFPTQIKITVINEPGVMADITKIIAEHNANIDNLKVIKHSQDIQDLVIDIEVFDLLQLNAILSEARQKKNVTKAERSGS